MSELRTRGLRIVPQESSYPDIELLNVASFLLSFKCKEGMIPADVVEAVCGEDGNWTPNPSTHTCKQDNRMLHSTN